MHYGTHYRAQPDLPLAVGRPADGGDSGAAPSQGAQSRAVVVKHGERAGGAMQ
jgi:hypothetical protein